MGCIGRIDNFLQFISVYRIDRKLPTFEIESQFLVPLSCSIASRSADVRTCAVVKETDMVAVAAEMKFRKFSGVKSGESIATEPFFAPIAAKTSCNVAAGITLVFLKEISAALPAF